MEKFLSILAFVVSALSLILAILRVVRKKQGTRNLAQNNNTITYGMRDIENPFENEILSPQKQAGDVVVKTRDYKWYKMYKYELMSIIAMFVIVIMVIILSFFSFKVRKQEETVFHSEKSKADSAIIHSLGSLEETSIVVKDILDSMDIHITEGKKELSNTIRELKGKKGNKR
ncbi:MAG: hypothetical protein ACI358_05705 [Candidatus Limimorpha sp.]